MNKKYRLMVDQLGLPAGTTFALNSELDQYEYDGLWDGKVSLPANFVENRPDMFKPLSEPWKPGEEGYWYIEDKITAEFCQNTFLPNETRLANRNFFRTQDQAEEAARRIRQTLMAYHEELGGAQDDD